MDVKSAIGYLKEKKYPVIPIKYCVVDGGVLLLTRSLVPITDSTPLLYMVENSGKVYPTNPFNTPFNMKDLKKIPTKAYKV